MISGIGLLLLLGAMYGWSLEPATDPDAGHGDHADEHGPDDDDSPGDEASEITEEDPVV